MILSTTAEGFFHREKGVAFEGLLGVQRYHEYSTIPILTTPCLQVCITGQTWACLPGNSHTPESSVYLISMEQT